MVFLLARLVNSFTMTIGCSVLYSSAIETQLFDTQLFLLLGCGGYFITIDRFVLITFAVYAWSGFPLFVFGLIISPTSSVHLLLLTLSINLFDWVYLGPLAQCLDQVLKLPVLPIVISAD
jgi:hypothetical protein